MNFFILNRHTRTHTHATMKVEMTGLPNGAELPDKYICDIFEILSSAVKRNTPLTQEEFIKIGHMHDKFVVAIKGDNVHIFTECLCENLSRILENTPASLMGVEAIARLMIKETQYLGLMIE
jgi:hypothetical protein